MSLRALIVGIGIAGLATAIALTEKGYVVVVVESTSHLQPIGGVITIQANACRILDRWGVYRELLALCDASLSLCVRRYKDGAYLIERTAESYKNGSGYRLLHIHRADLQRVLYEAALKRGVTLRLGCSVISIDEENEDHVAALIENGERIAADVIIGADGMSMGHFDAIRLLFYVFGGHSEACHLQGIGELRGILPGIKSTVRKSVISAFTTCFHDSGLDVTRVNIPGDIVRSDPEISMFMDQISLWIGPSITVAIIPVRRGDDWLLGLDCCHPRNKTESAERTRKQNIMSFRERFNNFAPEIQKLMSYIQEAEVWGLTEVSLPSWVSESGRIVLIGDAAHAILPYVGQGGGMAIEDAATLAECLGRVQTVDRIANILRAFQEIREPRCKLVQSWSTLKGKRARLPDGPEQEARDQNLKSANAWVKAKQGEKVHIDELPELESLDWKAWLIGHDAVGFANRELDKRLESCHV